MAPITITHANLDLHEAVLPRTNTPVMVRFVILCTPPPRRLSLPPSFDIPAPATRVILALNRFLRSGLHCL